MTDEMKRDMDKLKADVEKVKSDVQRVKCDVEQVKSDVEQVKSDVEQVKSDVEQVKSDVEQVKSDVERVKSDVEKLKSDVVDVRANGKEMAKTIVRLETKVDRGFERLSDEMRAGFRSMRAILDGFAGEIDTTRRHRTLQDKTVRDLAERLDNHELRVTRLERARP